MRTWVWSGEAAVVAGSVLFVVLFLPLVIWQFRRFGDWNFKRMLGGAAVCLYLTSIATYTWLPLPPRSEEWCTTHAVRGMQLEPFFFIGEIRQAFAANNLVAHTVLQVVFNVVLFIPWGILARGYLQIPWWAASLSGVAASVLVEATQYTGLWFYYPCAYRFADIDDVITNSSGAILGALLAPMLLFWMPKARQLQARRMEPRPLTWRRMAAAGAIDLAIFFVMFFVGNVLYFVGRMFLNIPRSAEIPWWHVLLLGAIPFFVVFSWTALRGGPTGSGSVGENSVWLTPGWRDRHGNVTDGNMFLRLFRWGVIGYPAVALLAIKDHQTWFFAGFAGLAVGALAIWAWKKVHPTSHDRVFGREYDIRDPRIQALDPDGGDDG